MLVVSCEQVKLGVFLDLNAQVIQSCDRCIASQEVLRTGTEGYDLEISQTNDSLCDRDKLVYHISNFGSSTNRILGNVSSYASQLEVVAGIEHTAVSVASVVDKCIAAVILSSCNEHCRAVEILSEQCFRGLGTEVAKVYN